MENEQGKVSTLRRTLQLTLQIHGHSKGEMKLISYLVLTKEIPFALIFPHSTFLPGSVSAPESTCYLFFWTKIIIFNSYPKFTNSKEIIIVQLFYCYCYFLKGSKSKKIILRSYVKSDIKPIISY